MYLRLSRLLIYLKQRVVILPEKVIEVRILLVGGNLVNLTRLRGALEEF